MSAFQSFWRGLDWSVPANLLLSVVPALVCITLHELAHGWVAWKLGDDTARRAGRLSLNPLRHIDWLGLVMMVTFHFGWAKPVPVDMRRFQKLSPKTGMAVTAAAGPLCNILITLAALFLYGLAFPPLTGSGTPAARALLQTLYTTAELSLSLAVFNVIPVSPLDGSKILFSFLSEEQYARLMRYERYGMLLLLVLVATGILRRPLSAVTVWLSDRLFVFAEWGFALSQRIV